MQAEGRHYSPIIDYYAVHDRIQGGLLAGSRRQ